MPDQKIDGFVLPLDGKYYGTEVSVGHAYFTIWDHSVDSPPSRRELAAYGVTEDWDSVPDDTKYDIICDSHYESTRDFELACLVAAAPELRAALQDIMQFLEDTTHKCVPGCTFREVDGFPAELIMAARTALAKAEGVGVV